MTRPFLWISCLFAAILLAAGPVLAAGNNTVAIIIGNKAYRGDVPGVKYAHRDAEAFRNYVTGMLQVEDDNIIDLRDASQAEMLAAFGSERSHQGILWSYLDPKGGSDVVVYYSGHGVPGIRDGRGYLLPVDADPNLAEINGYPLDLLYANLARLEARSVTVYLDACFSGDSPRGMLIKAASPGLMQVSLPEDAEDLTILTAASGNQLASWDEEAEHGLFTGFLMKALYGAGDGNGDGEVTAAEVKSYLDEEMTRAARRRFLRDQVASLSGDGTRILSHPADKTGVPSQSGGGVIAAPIPANGVMYVGSGHLNLRAGPGTIHEKLTVLAPGTRVRVLARSGEGGWLKVVTAEGRTGFVFDQFLQSVPPGKDKDARPEENEPPVAEEERVPEPAPGMIAPPPRPEPPVPPVAARPGGADGFWRPLPGDAVKIQPVRRNPVDVGRITRVDFKRGGVVIAIKDDIRARPLRPRERLVTVTRDGRVVGLEIVKMTDKRVLARPSTDLRALEVGLRVFVRR